MQERRTQMFERIKLGWNLGIFRKQYDLSQRAFNSKRYSLAISYIEKALNAGKKALVLSEELNSEVKKPLQKALVGMEEICQALRHLEILQSPEEKELRLSIKKQFVEMSSQIVTPGVNQADFIANRMVDMYRIAKDRLGAGEKVLRMIYIDNENVPESLKKVINAYLDGDITKEEAEQQLDELAANTRQYVMELGAKPETAKPPQMIFHKSITPKDKLESTLVAEAMKDDGSIDQMELFMNIAEIVLFDEWAGLSKRIGERDPTLEELLEAQLSAFRRCYERNKQLFSSEEEFNNWVNWFSAKLKEAPEEYTSTAIPAYRATVETIAKKYAK